MRWECTHHLLEALKEMVGLNSLKKAVLKTGEKKNEKVEVGRQPGFWDFNQEGLLEECMHSRVAGEDQRAEIAERA